jgi:hypothetical protein
MNSTFLSVCPFLIKLPTVDPVPVATLSDAHMVLDRSNTGIVGSNTVPRHCSVLLGKRPCIGPFFRPSCLTKM